MLYNEELTYNIIGSAMDVYNELGYGFLEKVYENALLIALKEKRINAKNQHPIDVFYHNEIVGNYIADIVVEGKVIIELKSIDSLSSIHEAQVINYLKATDIRVGLLINFSPKGLKYKRIVN